MPSIVYIAQVPSPRSKCLPRNIKLVKLLTTNSINMDLETKDIKPMHIDNVDANIKPQSEALELKTERRVIWKCDLHVVPVLMVLYLLAFFDRINIGNARLQRLEEDLGMEGNDYNLALFIFFIPYILCEIPCNLIMKRLAPSTWLSSIMALWGALR